MNINEMRNNTVTKQRQGNLLNIHEPSLRHSAIRKYANGSCRYPEYRYSSTLDMHQIRMYVLISSRFCRLHLILI